MKTNDLKFVLGKAEPDKPAVIRFFGPVNYETTKCFNEEFLWLQNYVKPSKIVVLINSEGGSVVYGMSTFSVIQSCPIEVDCVIEGIAASMGSIIWAAGDKLFMHDYSILMIHNPFVAAQDTEDENMKNMINAFKGQISTVYQKRFGLSLEQVREIMDGEGNADGTYFSAKEAVKAGILDSANIIKTSKQVREKVKNEIEGVTNVTSLRDIMGSIAADDDKLMEKAVAILEQNEKKHQDHKVMEDNTLFNAVAAQLGFSEGFNPGLVSNRITELLNASKELSGVKAKLDELKIQFAGKETEVTNLTEQLNDVKAKLQTYQDAEKAAKDAEIDAMVQAAIEVNKITAESKTQWVEMAHTNFDMVKNTLDSIPAREKITEAIANDPINAKNAAEAMTATEKELAAKVEAAVGKIELQKF